MTWKCGSVQHSLQFLDGLRFIVQQVGETIVDDEIYRQWILRVQSEFWMPYGQERWEAGLKSLPEILKLSKPKLTAADLVMLREMRIKL